MAKKSMVNREVKRAKLVQKHAAKRAALKTVIYDQTKSIEDRFKATAKLAALPRNSSATRIHSSAVSCCVISPRSARSPAWLSRAGKGSAER